MILNVSNLYKTYTRRGEEFNAVEDVEFFAWSGDFSVIYGESGSGKSTLLSLLSGINRPSQGSIIFNGVDFASLTDAELSAIRNDKIGYIPQESVFLPQFTVLENIFLPRAIREGNKVEVRDISELVDIDIHSKLETLGIAHLVNEMPAELSGGELKRASIVRALVLTKLMPRLSLSFWLNLRSRERRCSWRPMILAASSMATAFTPCTREDSCRTVNLITADYK